MKPLLSICIPTYNRSEYLKNSLESIICQQQFINGEVEIIISDNLSNDDTSLMVKEYTDKYSNIHYYRNSENIVDKNFPLALSRGSGVFRKLSNDTFVYLDGSMEYFCDLIRKYKNAGKQILFLNGERKLKSNTFLEIADFEQVAVTFGYWMGWSGIYSVWDSECKGIENDTDGCELRFWHTVNALNKLYKKKNAIICNKKLFYTQEVKGKDLSYGLYQVFYVNLIGIFKKYVEMGTLSNKAYEEIRKDFLFDFFTRQLILWETNYNNAVYSSDENPKNLIFKAYENDPYWPDYIKYYNKRKTEYIVKNKLKSILKKLHIWDVLVALHIKKK